MIGRGEDAFHDERHSHGDKGPEGYADPTLCGSILGLVEEGAGAPVDDEDESEAKDDVEEVGDEVVEVGQVLNSNPTQLVVVTMVVVTALAHALAKMGKKPGLTLKFVSILTFLKS
jgi:hypothetical protein